MVICYDSPNRRKHGNDNSQNMMLKLYDNNNKIDAIPMKSQSCVNKMNKNVDGAMLYLLIEQDAEYSKFPFAGNSPTSSPPRPVIMKLKK